MEVREELGGGGALGAVGDETLLRRVDVRRGVDVGVAVRLGGVEAALLLWVVAVLRLDVEARGLRPSARRSTRVALPQRGATGPADQITPSRAEQPRPMGTRRSGVAELTNRAHTRAEQPTSARAQWSEVVLNYFRRK